MSELNTQRGVISWFVRNPVAANLLMLIILLAGTITAMDLRIEGFPSFDPHAISIDVSYDSGDAEQAEEGIAIKIEEALQGVQGIKTITSTSTASSASVRVERMSGYDLDRLNTDIKNKIDGISSFPGAAERPIVSQQQWDESALWVSVYGDVGQHNLQRIARQFEEALLALPSVSDVGRTGWRTPEIAIEVDERALQAYQLTLSDLAERIRQESLSETSGELRSANGVILLKADKQRYFMQDFADVVVSTTADGSTVYLRDVAEIIDGFQETPAVYSRFNGQPAINLEVKALRDSDIVAIAEAVKQLSAQWQQSGRLPEGVELELWMDQSHNMLSRLSLVLENGLVGIVLVMLLLAVFLNLRIAFWVGMGLPICFAGALLLMGDSFFDLTLNQLTTFGFVLVLGILVDDAVVVGESVHAARRQLGDTVDATIVGVKRVAVPTMFGVLTTVAAFFPLSFVAGRLGSLFSQFALVCTACLLFSLLESKFILPAHLAHVDTSRREGKHWPGRCLAKAQSWADELVLYLNQQVYRPLVAKALHYRYGTLCLFLSLMVLVVGMVPSGKVGFHFFPEIPEEVITLSFTAEQGVGYGITHKKAQEIEALVEQLNAQWLQQYPNEGKVVTRMYSLVDNSSQGSMTLELSPKDQRSVPVTEVADALEQQLQRTEGLLEMLVSMDDHQEKDFELHLLSDDRQALQEATQQVLAALTALQGVNDIYNSLSMGQPQLSFTLTPEGRALGISTESLAQQIQQSFYGAEVQRLQRDKQEVRVRVRYPAMERADVTDLQHARIRTPQGEIVPLSTVATLEQSYTVSDVYRVNGQRAATLSANLDESVIESGEVFAVLENQVFPQLQAKYPQLQMLAEGDAAEEKESTDSLVWIFASSLLLIYILVAVPLKSYWQPLVIMSAIPFGIVGAILGHWASDMAISILSINGMLALSGVVVNDSLLLVNQYNTLRQEGMERYAAMIEAGSQRMRAILLTSMTTCLGLVSLLQETSEQAQFLIPAATSLAYGIAFATLITLILVPVLLMISVDVLRVWGTLHSPSEKEKNHVHSNLVG